MASRKEQKAALRQEREEREAAAKAEQRRRQMIGYVAGGVVVVIAVVVGAVLLSSGGSGKSGGGKATKSSNVLPSGGSVPSTKIKDLDAAAKAAGCVQKSYKGKSREHTGDINEKIKYDSHPPTEGKHYQVPADDGAYEKAPDIKQIVHTLEHGRVEIIFRKSLPAKDRADLKALFDEDSYHMLLSPDPAGDNMPYEVAATAWNADPTPNGTGKLLGCKTFNPQVFDAIRAFKEDNRDNGPETIP
jgi:hypothetical protein